MVELETLFSKLPPEDVYRGKGVVRIKEGGGVKVFNLVYGRVTYEDVVTYKEDISKMTFMGIEMERQLEKIKTILDGDIEYKLYK